MSADGKDIHITDDALAELLTLAREVDKDGTTRYRNSAGEIHRAHGPAETWADGTQIWYHRGHLHCAHGPAVSRADGGESWYLNGALHRSDGPSIVWPNGAQVWHWYGQQMPHAEWAQQVGGTHD